MMNISSLSLMSLLVPALLAAAASPADERFEELGKRYLDRAPAFSPSGATALGDHRFDAELDQVSPEARAAEAAFYREMLADLAKIDRANLSRANQVDAALFEHRLRADLWSLEELKEWEWNPLGYTAVAGGAIYNLMAREFAPIAGRLANAASRLDQFPRLLRQVRSTLEPRRVPKVHAETAIRQNRGIVSLLDGVVRPRLEELPAADRARLAAALDVARAAVEEHGRWLEEKLLPQAAGDFRLGPERYDQKLAFALETPLSRQEVRARAESELARLRAEMYELAKAVYGKQYPYTRFPENPDEAYRQAIVRAALEVAYRDLLEPETIFASAKESLELATSFVRTKELVTIPPDPVELIVMPEFQRGVSLAYCDSPGPLDAGQKTFYAVSPLPREWTPEQVRSFLREYNVRSLHNLTIHEAMPGHFLQIAHANRYPSKLRAVLASGVFIEGWAVYAEHLMAAEGYLGGDPLMKLIVDKWYLRAIANAIMDQSIHAGDMTEAEAMKLMIEDTFQEEREAAAKWVRAQLTSAQLSTYFVGTLAHMDLRREVERAWGASFSLKKYHDALLSFGSPPVQFARALLLNLELPRS